tara:strand:+ start:1781 stop:2347 length:567 start_codon:yes stop_codon:yes gene_type:complete
MNKKGINIKNIAIVLAIALISILILLFILNTIQKPRVQGRDYSHVEVLAIDGVKTPVLNIDLQLCETLDSNLKCTPKQSNIYRRGENINLLIKVNNIKSVLSNGKKTVRFKEFRDIYSPDGKLIEEVSGTILSETKESSLEGYIFLPIKNELSTSASDPLGEYRIVVIIEDDNSKTSDLKEIKFNLEP